MSRPLARAAVQVAVADAGLVEPGLHPGQEAGELAEHEGPVPFGHDLLQVLDEPVELGRADGVVLLVDEAGVEGELA